MNESSEQSSYCSQCHKQHMTGSKNQLNNLLSTDIYTYRTKDLKDAESRFHKLQKEIILLKEQNQKKIHTIEQLKKQVQPTKVRKSSLQIQIQDNRKSFQQLKHSLISFGNSGFHVQVQEKQQKQTQNRSLGSASTDLIINSLQKRLKQYKIELLKVIQKVELHQKSTDWMYQFIDSFIKMVVQINKTGRYGEPLVLKELSIKKKTKIAWKYLKDLLEKILNTSQ